MKTKVLKNTGAYLLIKFFPRVSGFIMLPIYTRFLIPEDYGILALTVAFTDILAPILSLQLGAGISRFFFDYNKNSIKEYFSTIFFSILVISGFISFIIHLQGVEIISFIFPKTNIPYRPFFFLALIKVLLVQLSTVSNRLIIVQEKGGTLLLRSLFGNLLGIGLSLYFEVYKQMGAYGAILGGVIGKSITLTLTIFLVRKFFTIKWKYNYFKESLLYGWPIIPHAVGGFLFMYSDKIIMEKFLALSTIGIYAIADRFAMLMKMLVNSFNEALHPQFMKTAKQGVEKLNTIFKPIILKWSAIIAQIYLYLAFFSEEAIIVLTPIKYHAAYSLIPILMLAYIFRGLYIFSSYPLFYLKKTKLIPIITITAGVTNIVLNIILIPIYGIFAAAWTTVIAFFITFIIARVFANRFFSIEFDWRNMGLIFIPMFICSLTIYALIDYENTMLKFFIKLVIASIYFGYCWRFNFGNYTDDIKNVVRSIKNKAVQNKFSFTNG